MSYRVTEKVSGIVDHAFPSEAEARAYIDEEVAGGLDNETDWLMALAQATADGAAVNVEDESYVRRILAAEPAERRAVALQCAKERMYADYAVVKAA